MKSAYCVRKVSQLPVGTTEIEQWQLDNLGNILTPVGILHLFGHNGKYGKINESGIYTLPHRVKGKWYRYSLNQKEFIIMYRRGL